MPTERTPWTAGRLREELARYPDETPLRVAVSDADHPEEFADWNHVVLGAARGAERYDGDGDITPTPYVIIESHPLDGED